MKPIHHTIDDLNVVSAPALACGLSYLMGGDESTREWSEVTCKDCLATQLHEQVLHYRTVPGDGPAACGLVIVGGAYPTTSILDRVTCASCRKAAPGMKYDGEKARMALLPFGALELVAKVMTYGAKKYAPNNWKKLNGGSERYASAMLRHYTAWANGERIDSESGLLHLAQMVCNALFLLAFEEGTDGVAPETKGGMR